MAVRTTQLSGPRARILDSSLSGATPWTVRRSIAQSHPTPLTAAAMLATIVLVVATASPVEVATALTIVALIPAALVDIIEQRLPNRLVAAGLGVLSIATLTEVVLLGSNDAVAHLGAAAMGSLALAGPLLVLHLVSPVAMGFGDVKYAAVLGAGVGMSDPMLALVALTAASAATALGGLVTRRRTLPFGPGLLVGAAIALCIASAPTTSGWLPATIPATIPDIDPRPSFSEVATP